VLADGVVVGRIFKGNAAPVGSPWMWTLAFGHHKDRTPTHGYAATREQAMAAFAKSGTAAWPLAAHAQQPGMPVVGFSVAHRFIWLRFDDRASKHGRTRGIDCLWADAG
jgi:hypothetical protein